MAAYTSTVTALLCVSLLFTLAHAQDGSVLRTISVSGTGTATTPPDLATINTGVVTMAKTAMEALDVNNAAFRRVLNTLKRKGVDEKDVQTTFFDVGPQFSRAPGADRSEIIGYRVNNQVQAKIRNLDSLGEVLDALVTAGSNRISGISFGIADPKPITNRARKLAVADAKSKAALYAAAAGVRLGNILSISENPVTEPSRSSRLFSAEAADSVPIATGELDVQATIFLLFKIGA